MAERRILITGVSRGLGQAMVEGFAAAGHRVMGCARSPEAVNQLRQQFPQQDFAVVDVTEDGAVAAWLSRIASQHGPPDLVLNNAGLINDPAPLWEVPANEVNAVLDVNLKGTINVIRHAVPLMLDGGGVIVNFSSGWGRSTSPEVAPYCASKWGIEGLTRSLAQELPSGLAAVALNPGIIHTD
ncbi:MAG: SDR family oxidoreductase, partial [Cyanobacteria bacterium P01_A01_bin.135]